MSSVRSLSFGITITVSAHFLNFSSPILAFRDLLAPSLLNGKVTIAIVKAPLSLASLAITGREPVPVPPPKPPVRKTMSASLQASKISCRASSAAPSPTFGSDPAPNPFVSTFPMSIL